MKEDLESAARYLQRAQKLRVVAEATTERRARAALLDIAEEYESMAASSVRIDQMDRPKVLEFKLRR